MCVVSPSSRKYSHPTVGLLESIPPSRVLWLTSSSQPMLTRKLASHPDRVIALARRAYTAASRPREARQRDRCGAHSLPPRTSSCPAPSCGSSHRVDLTLEPVDQVAAVAFVEEQKLAAWGEEVAAILTRRRPRLLVVLIKVMAPGGQSRGCRCSRVPLRGGGGRAAAWPVAGDADLRVGPLLPRTGVLRSAVSRARAWPSGPRRARTRRSRRVRRGPLLADALLPGRRHVSLALAWTISRSCSLDVAQVDLADGGWLGAVHSRLEHFAPSFTGPLRQTRDHQCPVRCGSDGRQRATRRRRATTRSSGRLQRGRRI